MRKPRMNTEELLKLLACPACKNSLDLAECGQERGFACRHCQVVYPIRDDIPLLLVEEAIPAKDWPGEK